MIERESMGTPINNCKVFDVMRPRTLMIDPNYSMTILFKVYMYICIQSVEEIKLIKLNRARVILYLDFIY